MSAGGLSDVISKILEKDVKLKSNESIVLHKEKSDRQRQRAKRQKEKEEAPEEVKAPARKRKAPEEEEEEEEEERPHKSWREREDLRVQWVREAFCGDEDSMREHSAREKRLRQQVRTALLHFCVNKSSASLPSPCRQPGPSFSSSTPCASIRRKCAGRWRKAGPPKRNESESSVNTPPHLASLSASRRREGKEERSRR